MNPATQHLPALGTAYVAPDGRIYRVTSHGLDNNRPDGQFKARYTVLDLEGYAKSSGVTLPEDAKVIWTPNGDA